MGKLGIRMAAIGRFLQVRYANWNNEFRLKFETYGDPESDLGDFQISEQVTPTSVLSFSSQDSQPGKQTDLVRRLFEIKGVAKISLHPYMIRITRAHVFEWDELRPAIEAVILGELTAKPPLDAEGTSRIFRRSLGILLVMIALIVAGFTLAHFLKH